jgi:hypothetical protein
LNKILVIIGLILLIFGVLIWYTGFTGMPRGDEYDVLDPEDREAYGTNKQIASAGVVLGIIGLIILAIGGSIGSKKEVQQLYPHPQYNQQQPNQQIQYGKTQYPPPYPQQTQEADNSRACEQCGMRISIYDNHCPYCGHIN